MLAYHAQTMTGYHGFWHWETCDWCEDCRDNMNDDRAFGVAAARVSLQPAHSRLSKDN